MTEYQKTGPVNQQAPSQSESSTAPGSEFMGITQTAPLTEIPLPPALPTTHRRPSSTHTSSARNSRASLPSISSSQAERLKRQSHNPSGHVRHSHYSTVSSTHTNGTGGTTGPEFRSALSYTEVRDYAYPEFHPLHYGVPTESDPGSLYDDDDYENDEEYPDSYMRDGGPPWKEDSDLASPVVISHSNSTSGSVSREYEFSVASADEIHGRAVALFDFEPENENEAPLRAGQIVFISYRYGQGWLVSQDPETGETGLVPEEYVRMVGHEETGYFEEESGDQPIPEEEEWLDEEARNTLGAPVKGEHKTNAISDSLQNLHVTENQ